MEVKFEFRCVKEKLGRGTIVYPTNRRLDMRMYFPNGDLNPSYTCVMNIKHYKGTIKCVQRGPVTNMKSMLVEFLEDGEWNHSKKMGGLRQYKNGEFCVVLAEDVW